MQNDDHNQYIIGRASKCRIYILFYGFRKSWIFHCGFFKNVFIKVSSPSSHIISIAKHNETVINQSQ